MRPITETLGSLDISSGTSESFNRLIKSISSDITTVFNKANENEVSTEKSMGIIIQENMFLQRKIKELQDKLGAIEQTISNKNRLGYKYIYKTFYSAEDLDTAGNNILHDPSYGIVTLPHSNNQKIQLLKYSREFLCKNIDMKVSILGNTIDLSNDESLLNIIDGDESTFWTAEIETGDNVNSVDFTVTINMPVRILPNLFINSIGIKPHPIYSMTLNDIKYVDANDSVEYRIPTFPVNNSVPIPIQTIENTKFMFPTIITNSITFSFTQPYYIQNGDKRKFIVGIRNIDLENLNVTSEESSFITTFRIPGDNRYFLRVMEPTVITLNDETYNDAVTHELFYDLSSSMSFPFSSEIAADINTVYIKTTLRRTGNIIPAIKGIRLQYMQK